MIQVNAKIDDDVYNDFFSACKLSGGKVTTILPVLMKEYTTKIKKLNPIIFEERRLKDRQRKKVKVTVEK